jgi:hypothetical protein
MKDLLVPIFALPTADRNQLLSILREEIFRLSISGVEAPRWNRSSSRSAVGPNRLFFAERKET